MRTLWPTLFAVVVLVFACSPLSRVRAAVERGDGEPVDPPQVVVRARHTCRLPPAPQTVVPEPGPAETTKPPAPVADPGKVQTFAGVEVVTDIGIEDGRVAFNVRGSGCFVAITGWYDATRDGVVGPGDYVGSLGPVEVHDRGCTGGNLNDVGPLRLALVSP